MAFKLCNLVKQTSASVGSGNYVLDTAGQGGWSIFADELVDGDTTLYVATDGVSRELGIGTFRATDPHELERTQILDGSNGTNPVSWPTGTRFIAGTIARERLVALSETPTIADEHKLLGLATGTPGAGTAMPVDLSAPLTTNGSTVSLNTQAPLSTQSGTLGVDVQAPLSTQSGAIGVNLQAPLAQSGDSLALSTQAPLAIHGSNLGFNHNEQFKTSNNRLELDQSISNMTGGRLEWVNGNTLTFIARFGNPWIWIHGTMRKFNSAITKSFSPSLFGPGTTYYVYAVWNGSHIDLELRYLSDSYIHNQYGIPVMTGDDSRTLVGVVYTRNGVFENGGRFHSVYSYWNRRPIVVGTDGGHTFGHISTYLQIPNSLTTVWNWGNAPVTYSFHGELRSSTGPGKTIHTRLRHQYGHMCQLRSDFLAPDHLVSLGIPVKAWLQAGIIESDVAIIADVDEGFFSHGCQVTAEG